MIFNNSDKERKLTINIPGKIDNLTLDINGVNIITGYNDAGKTYILKVIYTFFRIKAYIEVFQKTTKQSISEIKSFDEIRNKEMVDFYNQVKEQITDIEKFKEAFISYTITKTSIRVVEGILGISKFSFEYKEDKDTSIKISNESLVYTESEKSNCILCTSTKVLEYSNILMANPSKVNIMGFNNPSAVPDYDKDLINYLNMYYIDQQEKLDIRFDEKGNCEIKRGEIYKTATELGDGLKLKAILNTLKYNNTLDEVSILLLDEPDNGLHTSVYSDNLKKILEFKTVFLTTHNYTFINQINSMVDNAKFFACKTNHDGLISLDEITGFEASIRLRDILVGGDESFDYM